MSGVDGANAAERKIQAIVAVGRLCRTSRPCCHDVHVRYTDGSEGIEQMNARRIATYYDTLPDAWKAHFAPWRRQQCAIL